METFISSSTSVGSDSFSFLPPPNALSRLNFWLIVVNVPSCVKMLRIRSQEKILVRLKGRQEAQDSLFSEELMAVKWSDKTARKYV
jgi:hypothetical protein